MLKAQVNPGGALFQGGASIVKGAAAAAYAAPGAGSADMQPVERVLRMLYDAGTQFTSFTSTNRTKNTDIDICACCTTQALLIVQKYKY
jgi:hypothetical protein